MARGRNPVKWKGGLTDKEVRHLIKTVNDSLYRLEKAGVQSESAEYRKIQKYAISNPNGTGKMYNVNIERGTIRVSKDLSRYKTKEERTKFVEVLQNILQAKTRTVTGTRKAIKKAYETARELYGFKGSIDQYVNVWHTYREQVSKDKRGKYGSDKVMEMIERTNIYQLSQNELEEVFSYMEHSRTQNSGINKALKNVKGFKVNKKKLS